MRDDDDDLADFVENENRRIRNIPKAIISFPLMIIKTIIDTILGLFLPLKALFKTLEHGNKFSIIIILLLLILIFQLYSIFS